MKNYAANGYGLYDMAGNVYEYVNDWYQSDYYSESPTNDPPGSASGLNRVLRGGSWDFDTSWLRVALRRTSPDSVNAAQGFRCAGDTESQCTDADSDTYYAESGCGTDVDCDDSNKNVNPGLAEVCYDSVDNDCDGEIDCLDDECSDFTACDYTNSFGMTFKLLSPGTFTMGSAGSELGRYPDESQHEVTITKSFYMQTTEMTQGQYDAVMSSSITRDLVCTADDCPVRYITWYDIQTFLTALNALGEGVYRLPTEAEWEYAARARTTTAFANGDITERYCSYDPYLNAIGWYCYNSSDELHPVAQKEANSWGLYDMHGNAWEWVQDWYDAYPDGTVIDPSGPASGDTKVLRGGNHRGEAMQSRSANRLDTWPNDVGNYWGMGFRLLREP